MNVRFGKETTPIRNAHVVAASLRHGTVTLGVEGTNIKWVVPAHMLTD